MMKTFTNTAILCLFALCFATSCTGIKLENHCKSDVKQTVSVLPFLNDEYDCHRNIEKILERMCYQIVDGRILLNEYSVATSKKFEEISLEEFSDFARSRGVDLLVYGTAKITWLDPSNINARDKYGEEDLFPPDERHFMMHLVRNGKSTDILAMKQLLKGNYATVDCFAFDTKTKGKNAIFKNYKVKKVNLGQPSFTFRNLLD